MMQNNDSFDSHSCEQLIVSKSRTMNSIKYVDDNSISIDRQSWSFWSFGDQTIDHKKGFDLLREKVYSTDEKKLFVYNFGINFFSFFEPEITHAIGHMYFMG